MVLYGHGGHAKVIISMLETMQLSLTGIFDDDDGRKKGEGQQVLAYDPDFEPRMQLVIAIGNNFIRQLISTRIQHTFVSLVHTQALVDRRCKIDDGTVILHGSVVQRDAFLGKHVIVNTSASVDHDCFIEDFVHVAPGATICGGVQIGTGTLVGAGATILPGLKIGRWSIIGAGSVIIKDVPDFAIVVGNPGKIIKFNKNGF
jgi:sugar O-acyltransferase (sialic acid O-acetyltransferase NeuD family)